MIKVSCAMQHNLIMRVTSCHSHSPGLHRVYTAGEGSLWAILELCLGHLVIASIHLSSMCTFLLRLGAEVMSQEKLTVKQRGYMEGKTREFICNNSLIHH